MTIAGARRIISIFVVVPPRALLFDIAGPMEVLRKANLEQAEIGFHVTHGGPPPNIESSVGLGLSRIASLPETLPGNALVIVPGAVEEPMGLSPSDAAQGARLEDGIVAWLDRSIRPGIRLATICSGAIFAARVGLLAGYECTTHHVIIPELKRIAPLAAVRENRLFVEDRDRLTSAGITAGIDLMLHLVAQEAGHATALAVARHLVVYLRRGGADPQLSPWLEGRNHIHTAIHRAQDAVAADPARDWTVESLAKIAGTSPRNLSRLFNEHTGMTITDYVNRIRIALARELVTGSRLDMESVAERAGFASTRQFRRVWNRLHNISPARTCAALA